MPFERLGAVSYSPSIVSMAVLHSSEIRSDHSLMLNISEMAKDRPTAIVTKEGEYETVPKLSNGIIFNDLE